MYAPSGVSLSIRNRTIHASRSGSHTARLVSPNGKLTSTSRASAGAGTLTSGSPGWISSGDRLGRRAPSVSRSPPRRPAAAAAARQRDRLADRLAADHAGEGERHRRLAGLGLDQRDQLVALV